jgi:predicted RNA-binding Zn ribbon-like protein
MEAIYCPDCKTLVYADIELYDLDDPESPRILQCQQCGCAIDFIDE